MLIPVPKASSSPSPLDLLELAAPGANAGAGLFNADTPTEVVVPTVPGTTRRHRDSISFFLPIFILTILLIILILSLIFARCLYRRFKAMHLSPSPSTSSWKAHSSTTYGSNDQSHNHHNHGENSDTEEEDERTEQERLLARRRSTSYYDANRSRAPVAVVIQHDAKGRPISTWSTASSVAAQRGEELSRWSRRRDDLIKIYGQSNMNNSSFAEEDGPDEEDEQEDGGRHSAAYVYHQQGQGVEGEGEGVEGGEQERRHGGGGPLDGVSELGESHTHSHNYNHNHSNTHLQTHSNENPLSDPQQQRTTQSSQRSSRVNTTTSTLHEQHGGT
ncbi:hypothetical protein EC957_003554 [Mortierella hygrophila]|uniref:Uncharacterized protein n=1 Tax=Mortierella hygrophila TaxID=979708 RepID=A0A9P6F1T8_9FUNG|nr:hypothetical protein EC957_003554 [Mortierella hygrophila]